VRLRSGSRSARLRGGVGGGLGPVGGAGAAVWPRAWARAEAPPLLRLLWSARLRSPLSNFFPSGSFSVTSKIASKRTGAPVIVCPAAGFAPPPRSAAAGAEVCGPAQKTNRVLSREVASDASSPALSSMPRCPAGRRANFLGRPLWPSPWGRRTPSVPQVPPLVDSFPSICPPREARNRQRDARFDVGRGRRGRAPTSPAGGARTPAAPAPRIGQARWWSSSGEELISLSMRPRFPSLVNERLVPGLPPTAVALAAQRGALRRP